MNRPTEQNPEQSQAYTSSLINLFQQKGYECQEINRDAETIYVMKHEHSCKQSFEPKPKICIN